MSHGQLYRLRIGPIQPDVATLRSGDVLWVDTSVTPHLIRCHHPEQPGEWHDVGGGATGSHPNLAAHDTLGLATDADLTAHSQAADPHAGYATDGDLTTHAATAHGLSSHAMDGVYHSGAEVLPTQGQKNALAGTAGTPGSTNPYVTTQDARLSDARTPAAHAHADSDIPVTIARDTEVTAAISSHEGAADPHTGYQRKSEKAAASGYASLDANTKVPIAQLPTGSTATTVAIGNDARLSDARTPTAHAVSHQPGGSDAMAVDAAAATGSLRTLGTGATQAAPGSHAHAGIYEPAGAVAAHEAAGDPHAGYVREADPNWTDLTDGGSTALHSHTGGGAASDPNQGSFTPGSVTVTTGRYALMVKRLQLTGSQRLAVAGTGRLSVYN